MCVWTFLDGGAMGWYGSVRCVGCVWVYAMFGGVGEGGSLCGGVL